MSYLGRLQNSLKKKDLDRFIQYNPSTKKVRLKPGNYGSDNTRTKKRADAGTIDFHHYGGKKSKETKWEELITGANLFDKGKDKNDRTREDWKKVAKELGIGKVDSEKKVRRMIEFVRGGRRREEPAQTETAEAPDSTLKPYGTRVPYGNKPVDDQPRTSEPRPGGSFASSAAEDASMAAIRGGDDLNAWYQTKFVPHLEADANATNSEIGDDSRYFLKNFVFEPPKLGSIKDIFDRYKGEIEDLD